MDYYSDDIYGITNSLSQLSLNQNNNGHYRNNRKQRVNKSFIDINDRQRSNNIPIERVYKRHKLMRTVLPDTPVTFTTISERSNEFKSIDENLPHPLYLTRLLKVNNPFLKMSFDLKRTYAYDNVAPVQMYHGTKFRHVNDICAYNFDWRLAGTEKGHRYGQGVNFTSNPRFALNFCDPGRNVDKFLILSDVLIISTGIGRENLKVPPKGCDTTMRENKSTFVKFYDAEFCPKYVLYVRK